MNLIVTIKSRSNKVFFQMAPCSKEKLAKISGLHVGELIENSPKMKCKKCSDLIKLNLYWTNAMVVIGDPPEEKSNKKGGGKAKKVTPKREKVSKKVPIMEEIDLPELNLDIKPELKPLMIENEIKKPIPEKSELNSTPIKEKTVCKTTKQSPPKIKQEPEIQFSDDNNDDFTWNDDTIHSSGPESEYEIPDWCQPNKPPRKKKKTERVKLPRTQNRRTICHVCSEEVSLVNIKSHLLIHENGEQNPYVCNECGKRFVRLTSLHAHLIKSHFRSLAKFKCDKCPRAFLSKSDMDRHLYSIHGIGESFSQTCPHCNVVLADKSILKAHIISLHTDPKLKKKHTCEYCSKIFFRKTHYKMHVLTHLPEDQWPYHCEKCGKGFKQPNLYRKHMLEHENPAAILTHCKVCGKGFRYANSLNVHMRIHTGEQPYECKFCNKRFGDRSNYRSHMKAHEAEMGVKLTLSFEEVRLVRLKVLDRDQLIGAKKVSNDTI
uniref:CSON005096 protein n=1 Tax=Culicoides sonorensis TaxID=179676 RepID=A0A336LZM2_CULSO